MKIDTQVKLYNLDKEVVGELQLNETIFALQPRADIIKLVIDWQRAKARSGTHKTKTVSEVMGTTKKPFKQKGTGNARQGSLRSVHMRGGGTSHGPVVRDHDTDLPKNVRRLGVMHALSSKFNEGRLIIIDSLTLTEPKTTILAKKLKNFEGKSFFIIDGSNVENNFQLAARNIVNVRVVPQIGANVYDIIKHDYVMLSRDAVTALEERLR